MKEAIINGRTTKNSLLEISGIVEMYLEAAPKLIRLSENIIKVIEYEKLKSFKLRAVRGVFI